MFESLSEQVISLTRVNTNAAGLQPGQPLQVDVIPANLPVPLSPLNAVVDVVGGLIPFYVEYSIVKDGQEQLAQRIPASPADSKPELCDALSVAFSLLPPIDFGVGTSASKVELQVKLSVGRGEPADGTDALFDNKLFPKVQRTLKFPVTIPPIRLPALAVMASGDNFEPKTDGDKNAYCFFTPTLGYPGLTEVLSTYNEAARLLESLESAVGFVSLFLGPLKLIAGIAGGATITPGFAAGMSIPNFDDYPGGDRFSGGGFDNETACLLMVGPTRLEMEVCNATDFGAAVGDVQFQRFAPRSLVTVLTATEAEPIPFFIRQELIKVAKSTTGSAALLGLNDDGTFLPGIVQVVKQLKELADDAPDPTHGEMLTFLRELLPDIGIGVMCVGNWNSDRATSGNLDPEVVDKLFKMTDVDTANPWVWNSGDQPCLESARWFIK